MTGKEKLSSEAQESSKHQIRSILDGMKDIGKDWEAMEEAAKLEEKDFD